MTTLFLSEFHVYGLMIALGIIAGIVCAFFAGRYRGYHPDTAFDIAIWAVPFAIVGARLNFVFWDWMAGGSYDFGQIIGWAEPGFKGGYVGMAGLSIYGALMGAVLGIFCNSLVYKKQGKRETFLNMIDLGAPFLVLGQAIGRWGNIANQELYGPIVTNPNLQWFPLAQYIEDVGEWHQAFSVYESVLNLACCAFCMWMLLGKRRSAKGAVAATYFIWYGIVRASMELLREESFIMTGANGLPTSFIMALVEIVIGLCIYIWIIYRARAKESRIPLFVKREDWHETGLEDWEWGRDPSEPMEPVFGKKKDGGEDGLTEEEYERAQALESGEYTDDEAEPDGEGETAESAESVEQTEEAATGAEETAPESVESEEISGERAESVPEQTETEARADDGFARKKFVGKD